MTRNTRTFSPLRSSLSEDQERRDIRSFELPWRRRLCTSCKWHQTCVIVCVCNWTFTLSAAGRQLQVIDECGKETLKGAVSSAVIKAVMVSMPLTSGPNKKPSPPPPPTHKDHFPSPKPYLSPAEMKAVFQLPHMYQSRTKTLRRSSPAAVIGLLHNIQTVCSLEGGDG